MLTESQIATIKKAQKDVAKRTNDMRRSGINVNFTVDKQTNTVVCVRHSAVHEKMQVGVARCSKEDRFIPIIGMAVSLCRAANKKVPVEYLHF